MLSGDNNIASQAISVVVVVFLFIFSTSGISRRSCVSLSFYVFCLLPSLTHGLHHNVLGFVAPTGLQRVFPLTLSTQADVLTCVYHEHELNHPSRRSLPTLSYPINLSRFIILTLLLLLFSHTVVRMPKVGGRREEGEASPTPDIIRRWSVAWAFLQKEKELGDFYDRRISGDGKESGKKKKRKQNTMRERKREQTHLQEAHHQLSTFTLNSRDEFSLKNLAL